MLGAWTLFSLGAESDAACLAAALARALSRKGKRVLLVELSGGAPSLDLLLGVAERTVYTVSDVVSERVAPDAAFLSPVEGKGKRAKENEDLLFLPCEPLLALSEDAVTPLRRAMEAAHADAVLIVSDMAHLSLARRLSDGLLLLTSCEEREKRAAEALVLAEDRPTPDGFVLTHLPLFREGLRVGDGPVSMADRLHLPLFGIFPEEQREQRRAADNMAERMLGFSVPLLCGIAIEGMTRKAYFEYQ